MSMVRHWYRFPRGAVDAPSLEIFKARLDSALSNLVKWKVPLPTVSFGCFMLDFVFLVKVTVTVVNLYIKVECICWYPLTY